MPTGCRASEDGTANGHTWPGVRPSTGHLGDGPVAVRAVDMGLSIDQHAVGQFESRICGLFQVRIPDGSDRG